MVLILGLRFKGAIAGNYDAIICKLTAVNHSPLTGRNGDAVRERMAARWRGADQKGAVDEEKRREGGGRAQRRGERSEEIGERIGCSADYSDMFSGK